MKYNTVWNRYNKPCKDSCESRGEDYFWCHTFDNSWDYCSPTGGNDHKLLLLLNNGWIRWKRLMNVLRCSNWDGDSKRREALRWHVSAFGIINIIINLHHHHHYKYIINNFNILMLPTIMFISLLCLFTLIDPNQNYHIITTYPRHHNCPVVIQWGSPISGAQW